MATIQQLATKLNRDAAETLIRNAQAMPADKVTWKPLDAGRSTLEQMAECAVIAGYSAATLEARIAPAVDGAAFISAMAEFDTLEKAIDALRANTTRLVGAIEAFPTEELDTTIQMPYSPTPIPFAELLLGCYWNAVYHIGQISYIQTLYGDGKMH